MQVEYSINSKTCQIPISNDAKESESTIFLKNRIAYKLHNEAETFIALHSYRHTWSNPTNPDKQTILFFSPQILSTILQELMRRDGSRLFNRSKKFGIKSSETGNKYYIPPSCV